MHTPFCYTATDIKESVVSVQLPEIDVFTDDIDVYVSVFEEDEHSAFSDEFDLLHSTVLQPK